MAKRRKRGDGGISLRKDGRWEGRVVIGYDDKGLPVTKNILAKTKTECAAKLKQLKERITEPAPEQPKPGILLKDWLDHWYQGYKKPALRPNTQKSYERRIYQHIIPALGNIQMDKLTTADIQKFYAELKQSGRLSREDIYGEGLSDQTVRGIHTTLHAALDKAVAEKLIFRNFSDGCKLPPGRPKEMQVLTAEEMQRLLIQAKEEGFFELFLLELSTGLRRGEICALQWDDLNFKTGALRVERQVHRVKGELVVSQPKTKASSRSVILPAPVVNVLAQYRKGVDSRWMFPSPISEDSPRDPTAVRKRLKTILERAECKKVRFHDLRHVFCTSCLEHGMDVKTLSTIIGHVSSSTTLNVYAHATDAMKQEAAARIDHGIAKAEPLLQTKETAKQHTMTDFRPTKGIKRKWGTGSVIQCSKNRWRGYFSKAWPDGTAKRKDVYAPTKEECEALLKEAMAEMKAAINAKREQLKNETKAS